MSKEDIIRLIENCMDFEEGTLHPEDMLADFEEWDSLSALAIIAAVDESFHKRITGEELKKVKTVSELVKLINK